MFCLFDCLFRWIFILVIFPFFLVKFFILLKIFSNIILSIPWIIYFKKSTEFHLIQFNSFIMKEKHALWNLFISIIIFGIPKGLISFSAVKKNCSIQKKKIWLEKKSNLFWFRFMILEIFFCSKMKQKHVRNQNQKETKKMIVFLVVHDDD